MNHYTVRSGIGGSPFPLLDYGHALPQFGHLGAEADDLGPQIVAGFGIRHSAHECAAANHGLDETSALKDGHGIGDGLRGDFVLSGQLTEGRHLPAEWPFTSGDSASKVVNELHLDRRRGAALNRHVTKLPQVKQMI
jgi:hypothetical protein